MEKTDYYFSENESIKLQIISAQHCIQYMMFNIHTIYDVLAARKITVADVEANECTVTYVVERYATPNPVDVDEYAANSEKEKCHGRKPQDK